MKSPQFVPEDWNSLIDRAFALDEDHPMLSQSAENDLEERALGGPGSGHFGHSGRPGQVGGSGAGGGHTAASVAAKHGLDKDKLKKIEERILAEATTEAERKHYDEMAVAELIAENQLGGADSKTLYTKADGSYTEERLKVHENAMKQYFRDHKDKYGEMPGIGHEEPVVTFMAGMPGAGKSTAAADLQGNADVVTIDPDTMKKYLPEWNDGLGSNNIARESGDVADKLMAYAASRRMNIVIDGTMKTSGTLPATMGDGAIGKMAAFKEAGYRVETRFVDVGIDESIQNTVTRFHEQFEKTGSGRYVPTSFSRALADPKHGTKPRASFELAKNTGYRGKPLLDAWTHTRGWTGNKSTSNFQIGSFGTLTQGGRK